MFRFRVIHKHLIRSNHSIFNRKHFSTAHPADHLLTCFHCDQPTLKKVNNELHQAYKKNKYAKPIIDGVNNLYLNKKLAIHQLPNAKSDVDILGSNKIAAFSANRYQVPTIILASQERFKNAEQNEITPLFIHECTHAFDHLIAELSTEALDNKKISFNIQQMLQPKTSHPELASLRKAIQHDTTSLHELAEKGDVQAQMIAHLIRNIAFSYKAADFLDEIKAYFVQFTTSSIIGLEAVTKYLPQVSAWMENEFINKQLPSVELVSSNKLN